MPRFAAVLAVVSASLLGGACGGASAPQEPAPEGPTPAQRFAAALYDTRDAGSARVEERVVSDPLDYEMEIRGRARIDYNDALLTVTHVRHPHLYPRTEFQVRIADVPFVRRTNGRWYAPPRHTGEFELGFANFMRLVAHAYGRVRAAGPRTFLVTMSPARLAYLRTQGAVGPLGTLHDLRGPMRVELDARGRIARIEFTVTGRYYFSLTPAHTVDVTIGFSDFEQDFEVEPPPKDLVTPGPLEPPQPGARADTRRL